MPARTASESPSHDSTTSAKSGDFAARNAKQDAKTGSAFSENLILDDGCGDLEMVFGTIG
jgi:hypothetical protein